MPLGYTVGNIQEALAAAGLNVLGQIASFLPSLVAAIITLLVGLIVARLAKNIIIKLLSAIKLSKLLRGSGINQFLKKADLPLRVEEVLGQIARWIIILIFFIAAMNILGLTAVSAVLNSILAYIPSVLSAALILAIGVLVAGFLESLVKGALGGVSAKTSRLLGKITSYTIIVFVALAAISELGIAQQFISIIFAGLVATLAIGFGLAIGLGAKETVAELLKDWLKQLK
jgi:hypothetical protein